MATEDIQKLKNRFNGLNCYIVGKGPSLTWLTYQDFISSGPGPVIALNHAAIKVNTLGLPMDVFAMEKDCGHGFDLGNMILVVHSLEKSKNYKPKHTPRYSFNNRIDFGLKPTDFSALSAIQLGLLMGCKHFILISFDAATMGSLHCFHPSPGKGGLIVTKVDDNLVMDDAYLKQARRMKATLKEVAARKQITFEFVTPSREDFKSCRQE